MRCGCGLGGTKLIKSDVYDYTDDPEFHERQHEAEATGVPAVSNYREFARQNGFPYIKVFDWTSSAGDWTFIVSRDGRLWQVLSQTNRFPSRGFDYYLSPRVYEGTADEVMQQLAAEYSFGDIVDPDDQLLWDTIGVVGTSAPYKEARDRAKKARWVASEGPERLRQHVVRILWAIRKWQSPRGQQVKAILREYAKPRGM
jgi:hypothetical protein